MSTKRIVRIWRDRIDNDEVWEHAKIRQWCKAIYALSVHDMAGGFRTALDQTEAAELCDRFNAKYPGRNDGPLVTEQQAAIGRHWLETKGVRFGLQRDGGYNSISHFRFVDVQTLDVNNYRAVTTPVYVAFWPDGRVLRYWATPWQDQSDFDYSWGRAA